MSKQNKPQSNEYLDLFPKIQAIFGYDASFGTDQGGQIVIYTGKVRNPDGSLRPVTDADYE